MNILPTKSWHVRNKKNIEKVRRDEAKAAEEEKEKQRKIAIAESEARSELLRKAAKQKRCSQSNEEAIRGKQNFNSDLEMGQTADKHINFFEDLEAGNRQGKKNKEHESELKLEKEKKEKEIGYLTYLGQNSNELNDTKPWYYEARSNDKDKNIKDETEVKRKRLLDPLSSISKFIDKTHKYQNSKQLDSHSSNSLNAPQQQQRQQIHRPHLPKTIDQLRTERLLREKMERYRQKQLLQKLDPKNNPTPPTPQFDDRSRAYNSRYNPQLSTR